MHIVVQNTNVKLYLLYKRPQHDAGVQDAEQVAGASAVDAPREHLLRQVLHRV